MIVSHFIVSSSIINRFCSKYIRKCNEILTLQYHRNTSLFDSYSNSKIQFRFRCLFDVWVVCCAVFLVFKFPPGIYKEKTVFLCALFNSIHNNQLRTKFLGEFTNFYLAKKKVMKLTCKIYYTNKLDRSRKSKTETVFPYAGKTGNCPR